MKKIVISGINLFEGGPLSVYKDCLDSIIELGFHKSYHVTIFVNNKIEFVKYSDKLEIIELPKSRTSYIYRIWYEYIYFYFYSYGKNIDVWLSLHDITPNVISRKRYVYCHNTMPFYKLSKFESKFAPKLKLFSLFYKYLYKINIHKNTFVIVQQNWIKKKFIDEFRCNNILVAHPDIRSIIAKNENGSIVVDNTFDDSDEYSFFYPSFPRVFKNFEIICEAVEILIKRGISNFKVVLTLDGTENKYSKFIYEKYSDIDNIEFVGLLDREKVFDNYKKSDCLIFPSKLESWGLPITEYKTFGKPIIISNVDYAIETIGEYDLVCFFDPCDSEMLANIVEDVINKTIVWEKIKTSFIPDTNSWSELLKLLI